jgi:hypothetical protein
MEDSKLRRHILKLMEKIKVKMLPLINNFTLSFQGTLVGA